MKKLLVILSFIVTFNSFSQNDGLEICFQYQESLKGFTTDKEVEDALNKILNVIGASRNFVLVPCDDINNALAITYKGERYILYDKDFIEKIEDITNDWSGLFILAHEIGHHINGHTRDFLLAKVLDEQSKEKQREEELEADEFAGFIVANLGASQNDIIELFDVIGSKGDDSYSTHPSKDKRLLSAKKGFNKFKPKVEIVKESITNEKPKLIKSGNWVSSVTYPRGNFKKEYRERGWVLSGGDTIDDPFDIASESLSFPLISKHIYATGYSFDGKEKITLNIGLDKWNNKMGVRDDQPLRYQQLGMDDYDLKTMEDNNRYLNIRNGVDQQLFFTNFEADKVKNHGAAPRFTREEGLAEEFPDYELKVEYPFKAKLSYMIDDSITGHFYVLLWGWAKKNWITKDEMSSGITEIEETVNYGKPVPYYIAHIDIGYDDGTYSYQDDYENVFNNFLKFMEGIKNGKTLYMKIENTGYSSCCEDPSSRPLTKNYLIKPTTYVFNLTGSSKAIGQYKGDL